MDEKVMQLVHDIDTTRSGVAASAKDELRVMRSMLNDSSYQVDVYGKNGKEGALCPYDEARNIAANIIKTGAGIPASEAVELAQKYEFTKSDAQSMIAISKEFVNTYLETGRKLPLGGREKSNISIARKIKEERVSSFPVKVGVNADGTDKYESSKGGVIPAHGSLKVYSPAPAWVG